MEAADLALHERLTIERGGALLAAGRARVAIGLLGDETMGPRGSALAQAGAEPEGDLLGARQVPDPEHHPDRPLTVVGDRDDAEVVQGSERLLGERERGIGAEGDVVHAGPATRCRRRPTSNQSDPSDAPKPSHPVIRTDGLPGVNGSSSAEILEQSPAPVAPYRREKEFMSLPTPGRRLILTMALSLAILAGCAGTNRNIKEWSKAATSGTLEQFQKEIPQARSLIESLGEKPTLPEVVRLVTDGVLQALADFLAGHPLDQALIRLRDNLITGIDLAPLVRQFQPLLDRLQADLPRILRSSGREFGAGFGEGAGRPFGRGFAQEVAALTRDQQLKEAIGRLSKEVGHQVAAGVVEGLEQSLPSMLARFEPQLDEGLRRAGRQVTLGVIEGGRQDISAHARNEDQRSGERALAYYVGSETARGTLTAYTGGQWLVWVAIGLGTILVLGLLSANLYLILLLRRQARGTPPAA